eukprot:TRINITY_DN12460_c0_g6_i3.p1 TRINITY_DN12460_c0_g6~~TRINITY_DN12460_c0_g6_i3.p1  ORF type:complete len:107 (+),score=2.30 TRINITY_DN12460_c0_g6_i3:154-474(+)
MEKHWDRQHQKFFGVREPAAGCWRIRITRACLDRKAISLASMSWVGLPCVVRYRAPTAEKLYVPGSHAIRTACMVRTRQVMMFGQEQSCCSPSIYDDHCQAATFPC